MARTRRRGTETYISEEERRRQQEEFYRRHFSQGVELLERLSRNLGRDYKAQLQFPPLTDEGLALRPTNKVEDPIWDGRYAWEQSQLFSTIACGLLIQAAGGSVIAVACRKRHQRGDPPVDVDASVEEMENTFLPCDFETVDGAEGAASAPPKPMPVQAMLEFCAASVTHSGAPVLVPEDFTDKDRRKAMRALAKEVRRVALGEGQALPPPEPVQEVVFDDEFAVIDDFKSDPPV